MDNVGVSTRQSAKKVSFQETIPAAGSLKRMPSHPDIPTYQHPNNQTKPNSQSSPSPPQVPARNIFFTPTKAEWVTELFGTFRLTKVDQTVRKDWSQYLSSTKLWHDQVSTDPPRTKKLEYFFLISHWLKWSILNQSKEIKEKMRSFKTEYQQALRQIIPFV